MKKILKNIKKYDETSSPCVCRDRLNLLIHVIILSIFQNLYYKSTGGKYLYSKKPLISNILTQGGGFVSRRAA